MTITVRLSQAQVSALQCREGGGLDDCPVLRAAWAGDRLTATTGDAEALLSELIECANAEDAQAEERGGDVYAYRAAQSFSAMGRKLVNAMRWNEERTE